MVRSVAVYLGAIAYTLLTLSHPNFCFDLLILHVNDMHARFEKTSSLMEAETDCHTKPCYGGFSRIATVVREARSRAALCKGPPVLFLTAGDIFTGTVWFTKYRSQIALEFMNLLHPDASCLGNHEFDLTVDNLVPYIDQLASPVVCANINTTAEPALQASKLKPSVVLEVAGRKIGVVGYIWANTQEMLGASTVTFKDEIESLVKETKRLHAAGVHILIALGHSGYTTDIRIAANVPLIDLVIGGHSHTFLSSKGRIHNEIPKGPYPKIVTQSSGKRVPVVQAYAYTKYIGVLNTTFNEKGDLVAYSGQPMLLDDAVEEEPDVLTHLEKYQSGINILKNTIVGSARVRLEGGSKCRTEECNLGNLITDAMVDEHASKYTGASWTDAPIAIINGGGIRSSIMADNTHGNISESALLSVLPFHNTLTSVPLQGKQLRAVLEHSVSEYETNHSGRFLQLSGLDVQYDTSKPVGQRVRQVLVRCSNCSVPVYLALQPFEVYTVLMFDFLTRGGDGYRVIQDVRDKAVDERVSDIDVLHNYLRKKSPVAPEVSGRIQLIHENATEVVDCGVSNIFTYWVKRFANFLAYF